MESYRQPNKIKARHLVIKKAVEDLTVNRSSSAIVKRNYVRDIYDYFMNKDEISQNRKEVNDIEQRYIVEWERLHDTNIGKKSPDELVICYLCGPEPNNDFKEFIDLGVLPQNIWAFENCKNNYDSAINSYADGEYPQPKIIKQNLDSFFLYTPKQFDIVYFDACSTLVSEQHSLKCLKTMFEKNRLNSLGVLITNFSAPDLSHDNSDLIKLITLYLYFKMEKSECIKVENNQIINEGYLSLEEKVFNDFEKYYDKFISAVIDYSLVIAPVVADLCTTSVALSAPPNSYQNNSQS